MKNWNFCVPDNKGPLSLSAEDIWYGTSLPQYAPWVSKLFPPNYNEFPQYIRTKKKRRMFHVYCFSSCYDYPFHLNLRIFLSFSFMLAVLLLSLCLTCYLCGYCTTSITFSHALQSYRPKAGFRFLSLQIKPATFLLLLDRVFIAKGCPFFLFSSFCHATLLQWINYSIAVRIHKTVFLPRIKVDLCWITHHIKVNMYNTGKPDNQLTSKGENWSTAHPLIMEYSRFNAYTTLLWFLH